MKRILVLLVFVLIVKTYSDAESNWSPLPRIPFGSSVVPIIHGEYLAIDGKVKHFPSEEWVAVPSKTCRFQGRFCVSNKPTNESELENLFYVDMKGSKQPDTIRGIREALRSAKLYYGLINGGEEEYVSSSVMYSGMPFEISQDGLAVIQVPFKHLWLLFSSYDSVVDGKTSKYWKFSSAVRGQYSSKVVFSKEVFPWIGSLDNAAFNNGVIYIDNLNDKWVSRDSARTWARIQVFPESFHGDSKSDTMVAIARGSAYIDNEWKSVCYFVVTKDNGLTWDTTGRGDDCGYYQTVSYRLGKAWLHGVETNRYWIRSSSDFGLSWKIERVGVRDWGGSRYWGVTAEGGFLVADSDRIDYMKDPSANWDESPLPVDVVKIRKVREIGNDLLVQQGPELPRNLLRYHDGVWDLVLTDVQDFEVIGNQVFAMRDGLDLDSKGLEDSAGLALPHQWLRALLQTRDFTNWDTVLVVKKFENCQFTFKAQSIECSGPVDRISLSKSGYRTQLLFAAAYGNGRYEEPRGYPANFESLDSGRTWMALESKYDPVPVIDSSKYRVDELGSLFVKNASMGIAANTARSKPRILGRRLMVEVESGSRLVVDVVGHDGKVDRLVSEIVDVSGVRTFEMPRRSGVQFVRVLHGGRSSVLPIAF